MNEQELTRQFRDEYDNNIEEIAKLAERRLARTYLIMKRLFDIVLSTVTLVMLSPFMLCIAAVIKATTAGPAIYRQERIGRGGKAFVIYKFRTMVDGAENLKEHLSSELIGVYEKSRKLHNDPRITKVGSYLRKTSLDELPQLINIIIGSMSVVGPRPMMPEEIEMYGINYKKYITVKPGLTGLWQIMNRSQTEMSDRARLDVEYIENVNMIYDLKIIFKTIGVVLSKKGAC